MDEHLLHDMKRSGHPIAVSSATQKSAKTSVRGLHYIEQKWALRIFRFGFAGVFFINAVVAWLQPEDFLKLMQKSLATSWLSSLEWIIPIIAINDLAIAIVILTAPKRYRPYVYAWVGIWFLAITIIKVAALNIFVA